MPHWGCKGLDTRWISTLPITTEAIASKRPAMVRYSRLLRLRTDTTCKYFRYTERTCTYTTLSPLLQGQTAHPPRARAATAPYNSSPMAWRSKIRRLLRGPTLDLHSAPPRAWAYPGTFLLPLSGQAPRRWSICGRTAREGEGGASEEGL